MTRLADKVARHARNAWGPLLLAVLTMSWFYPVREGAIGFDDVRAINRWTDPHVGILDRTALDVTANRWRPVFSTVFTLLTDAFGKDYAAYFWFNVILTLALVLLVYRLVRRLSSSTTLATGIAVVAVTSRFAYYQVTQVIGPVEALSLVFMVLLVGKLVDFELSGRAVHLVWVVLYYTLIIHTHERYVGLILFLIPLVLTSRSLATRSRAIWCGVMAVPLALNIGIRHFALHLPILVGTGSATELGFTLPTAVQHYALSVLSVLGINVGPGYLNGLIYPLLPTTYKVASVALLVISLVVVGAAFTAASKVRGNWLTATGPRRNITLGLLLVGVLILSFSVTIRVEPRWFYAPFLVLLLLIAYSVSILAQRRSLGAPTVAVVLIFISLSVALDNKYANNLEGVYFMGARAQAAQILDQTVNRYGVDLKSRPLYVVDATQGANWQAMLSPLIEANSDLGPLTVTTVHSRSDVPLGIEALVYEVDITNGFLRDANGPAVGFQTVGDFYADGWVGRSFGIRASCERLTLTISPFRPSPDRYVTITALGKVVHRYPLTQPEVTVALTGKQFAGGLDATFDRAFVPRDERVGQDVRALAAQVSIACTPPTGG